jgi:hypothetical protein
MKCPGQDSRYWQSNAIFETTCAKCGAVVEFFKDDTTRKCDHCGHRMMNPKMDFGCASYCEYAEQCLGTLPPELAAGREDLLKDRVAVEMKRYFKSDFKRIGHAMRVARHAEAIGRAEGGNLSVILPAAYLNNIGIHEAERKHPNMAHKYQETEGPAIARSILEKLGADDTLISEVVDIVGHHHSRNRETVNLKVLYDADLIANLEETHKESPLDAKRLESILEKSLLTEGGRTEAVKVFKL